jgi:hypothetical protein
MRSAIALIAANLAVACATTHTTELGRFDKHERHPRDLQVSFRRGDLEVHLADSFDCGLQTHMPIMLRNLGSEPVRIDPSDYYVETPDGTRLHHITHGATDASQRAWWIEQLLLPQELEPGASVRGLLVFKPDVVWQSTDGRLGPRTPEPAQVVAVNPRNKTAFVKMRDGGKHAVRPVRQCRDYNSPIALYVAGRRTKYEPERGISWLPRMFKAQPSAVRALNMTPTP